MVAPRPGDTPDIEEVPDPLEQQIPIIVAVLDAFGIAIVGADHYEADDVIGTLATDAGMPVDIVTGDRDLFQLVDDEAEVRVLYIARGVGKHERVTTTGVREKLRRERQPVRRLRHPPRRLLRRAAGCRRRGRQDRRGAAQPLRRPRLRSSPRPRTPTATWGRVRAARSRPRWTTSKVAPKVVAVARDIDLDNPDLTLPSSPADPEMLEAIAEQWGLNSPVERLRETLAR